MRNSSDALKPKRLFFPVKLLKPESSFLNDDIDDCLVSGRAEMVTVQSSSYPEVKEGVLLKEDFVT